MGHHEPVTDWKTDFDHTDDVWAADPYPIWAELRETCPVAHTERYGGVWLPTRHEDIASIAYDTERFTSRSIIVSEFRPPMELAPQGIAPPISSDPALHVLYNIDRKDDYIIGGCVDDLWVAVSTLISLYPWLEGQVGYSGISFGGGIGALAIPFDERIDRGHLVVPTFGHRPFWLTLPTVGSADAVQTYQKTHANLLETLRLFDAACAATRIKVPMLIAPALFDPAVAPPCQFAVANALPKSKFNEIFILDAGHFDYPDSASQDAVHKDKVRRFFKVP